MMFNSWLNVDDSNETERGKAPVGPKLQGDPSVRNPLNSTLG